MQLLIGEDNQKLQSARIEMFPEPSTQDSEGPQGLDA